MAGKSKNPHDREILYGMANPWADFWANRQEERGKSFSQQNIYNLCPEPPRAARAWARRIADQIVEMNGGLSLGALYLAARHDGFDHSREDFGSCLGCQANGMGISWDDDLTYSWTSQPNLKIAVPQSEFYI